MQGYPPHGQPPGFMGQGRSAYGGNAGYPPGGNSASGGYGYPPTGYPPGPPGSFPQGGGYGGGHSALQQTYGSRRGGSDVGYDRRGYAQPAAPQTAYGQPAGYSTSPSQQRTYQQASRSATPMAAAPSQSRSIARSGQPDGQAQQPQPPTGAPGRPLTGRRKSLLIGINYYGQQGELGGCINDVVMMRRMLSQFGFPTDPASQLVLTDDPTTPRDRHPTRSTMLSGFRWLVADARPGDSLFFHYSGHGSQVADLDGDEADGYDETIVPLDHKTAGQITDDVIFDLLVAPLPQGCRLTAVMDCCHSGSAMDLPYEFVATKKALSAGGAMKMAVAHQWDFSSKIALGISAISFGAKLIQRHLQSGGKEGLRSAGKKSTKGEVIMFSGCADDQTSADVANVAQHFETAALGPGARGGACTAALCSILNPNAAQSFVEILKGMRENLERRGFKQVPQLSASLPVDLYSQFSLNHLLSG